MKAAEYRRIRAAVAQEVGWGHWFDSPGCVLKYPLAKRAEPQIAPDGIKPPAFWLTDSSSTFRSHNWPTHFCSKDRGDALIF